MGKRVFSPQESRREMVLKCCILRKIDNLTRDGGGKEVSKLLTNKEENRGRAQGKSQALALLTPLKSAREGTRALVGPDIARRERQTHSQRSARGTFSKDMKRKEIILSWVQSGRPTFFLLLPDTYRPQTDMSERKTGESRKHSGRSSLKKNAKTRRLEILAISHGREESS